MPGLQQRPACPSMCPSSGWHDHRQWRQNNRGLCQGQAALPLYHLCQVIKARGPGSKPHSFMHSFLHPLVRASMHSSFGQLLSCVPSHLLRGPW